MIGEAEARGRGYAHVASKLILNYGFRELGLQKISLRVFADNERAIHLYERVGFVREGCLRREFLKESAFRDVILMATFDRSEPDAR